MNKSGVRAARLGDFTLTPRTLLITAVALAIGGASAVGEITLDQLLHPRREGLREEEHRERSLTLVLVPPARPRAGER